MSVTVRLAQMSFILVDKVTADDLDLFAELLLDACGRGLSSR